MNLEEVMGMGALEQQKMAREWALQKSVESQGHGGVFPPGKSPYSPRSLFWGENDPRKKSVFDSKFIPMKGAPAKYEGVGMDMVMPAITAFHASPHRFSKFDTSKIGTGEGAQAYGHGLYFAENPEVAGEYAKSFKRHVIDPRTGEAIRPRYPAGIYASEILSEFGGSYEKAKKVINLRGGTLQHQENAIEVLNNWERNGIKLSPAHTYKVDIPDDQIAKMLDWDKPLSGQSTHIKSSLKKIFNKHLRSGEDLGDYTHYGRWDDVLVQDPTIEYMMRSVFPNVGLGAKHGGGASKTAEVLLNEGGIPGIKYLDQGSRRGGKGTSNFVVFDEQIPQILAINDKPMGPP